MKYTSRADLLIAAGESIKMQEKFGITPVCKRSINERFIEPIIACSFKDPTFDYEFPLAVVEGKPVFVGDELYDFRGAKFVISEQHRGFDLQPEVSWLPPKPKTVMIELLREDAEKMATQAQERLAESYAIDRVGLACRKALESK